MTVAAALMYVAPAIVSQDLTTGRTGWDDREQTGKERGIFRLVYSCLVTPAVILYRLINQFPCTDYTDLFLRLTSSLFLRVTLLAQPIQPLFGISQSNHGGCPFEHLHYGAREEKGETESERGQG